MPAVFSIGYMVFEPSMCRFARKVRLRVEQFDQVRINARGGAQTVTEAAKNLGDAMGSVKGYLETIQDLVADLSFVPKEVSMEIGLKITAAAGVVIASAGTEGTLKIALKWEPGARKAAS